MLDIHAHLFWDSYDADRDEVIRRAREAGVEKMICVGTSPEDNLQAIAVAEQYDDIYASVGLHPHFFNELGIPARPAGGRNQESWLGELKKSAKHPKVIAIGECGLDYFSRDLENPITDEQKRIQREGFLMQIGLAEELKLPIIIHTRPSAGTMDAYEDLHAILSGLNAKPSPLDAVLHCYQGNTEITKKFLTLPNVCFSFAGTITYPVKPSVAGTDSDPAETVKLIPLERMFVETDCPFLSPQGHRGERNEPAYVRMIAERICAMQGITMAALEAALDVNFKRVFASR